MKYIFACAIMLLLATSCGINKQTNELKALEDCKYSISSADSLYVAGTPVKNIIANNGKDINLAKMPGIALGILRKNIPLEGRVNVKIDNPTGKQAGLNQFQYLVLIKGTEIANGFVNQKISVSPGNSTVVPINIKANIYQLVSDEKSLNEILDFLSGGQTAATEKKGLITIKIKPTISIGDKLINYPGYITIDKEISSKILF